MAKYKINKGFITQKLDDKIVIFDSEESMLYTLNETASYIFKKLKSGWDKEKIIQNIGKKYKINQKKINQDFDDLIENLIKKNIIFHCVIDN